ncbi:hypothetical protein [Streptomyces sp. WZ-12]|uniref:hypothetical protein n=1 Tax=Streptomyces sp. WZ-12 TaxID=3030210 RepID=UPI0023815D38|nr:hypothetical protein [Streptomyces sp. WZ-12]
MTESMDDAHEVPLNVLLLASYTKVLAALSGEAEVTTGYLVGDGGPAGPSCSAPPPSGAPPRRHCWRIPPHPPRRRGPGRPGHHHGADPFVNLNHTTSR